MRNLLITTTLLTVFTAAPAFADVIGRNAAVKGSVTLASQGEEARKAIVSEDVFLGDAVKSRAESSLQVLLLDETVFTVGPKAELVIDRFVYDPSKSGNAMSASVKRGMFRFMSGNIAKSDTDAVTIDTPVASLGIRGTIVEGLVGRDAITLARQLGLIAPGTRVDPDGATLFVLRGPGAGSPGGVRRGEIVINAGGQQVTLNQPGQAVFVASRNDPPSGVFQLSQDAFEIFSDTLRTKPDGPPSGEDIELDRSVDEDRDLDDIFDPEIELIWPDEDIFDSPCGPLDC